MPSLRELINPLTHLQAISTDTISASSARRRQVRNTLFRLGLAVGGALVLLCGLILNLAGIAPSLAAGGLSVEILAGYNLVVDSNVTSPSTAGPSAFTPGARICNTTASPINDVVVKIGDFANNTAGIYPERGPGTGSFNTDHPALVDGGGTYAFTHEGGSQGIGDATRLVGTLGPGECVVQYWTLSYPRCENVAGVADDPQCQNNAVWGSSVKPEDDLYLDFDVWATGSGGADGISSRTMYMRNEISAMANKIQPNGNLGSTWFSTDLDQVKPGSVITTNGILYRIGNVRFGFDNDGDYQPDYNFWMQPIGDASLFDTGCFRLIRTSGVITIAGGTDTSFTFEDQLYFTYPQVPTDNTNVIGEVHYTFLALGDNCAVTPTPYQEAASGYDNEKFNADYGAGGNEPFSSTPVEVTVDKNSLPSLTGPGSFVTYEIPFQNTSTTDSAGLVLSSGDVIVNTPLVISDTIPPEVEYQAGSATSSFSTSGLTATVYYSIDNGDSWTTIEPTPAISVTTIQWWLSDSLPPTEDGSATFQVFIPLDYSLPVLENCTNLQYGNGPSVTEACVTTIITGPNSIGDFVWRDEDSDGVQDGGAEVGIDAITVTLYYDADGNGQLDTSTDLLLTSTVTSGGGSYLFDNLADGNYLVVVSTDDPDLPFGYKITTDKVVVVDLDSSNTSTAAVDYLDADFGFGPALSVNKTLISGSPAYQGREVQYKIQVNNLRSASGEPVGNQCVYDMWASNFAQSGTDWVDEANDPITNADNIFSSLGPNGNYAVGDFGGSGDLLRADTYDVSDLNGPIVKVEALYSFYKGGTLFETNGTASDDEIYGRVYTGATQLVSNRFSNAVLNTYAGPAKQGVITFNVTSLYGAWDTSLFATLNSGLYIQKGASADGAILNIDAMGFRVTIDQPCLPDPADTLNPVPLSDNFDADLLEFVSADPPQTTVTTGGTSPYGNTGLIEWTNIGPIGAGETKEITLTFKGLVPGATGQTLTNTAVVSNAYFASGERANGGADDAVTIINPTGSISGVVWSDVNNNGWQSTTGYDSSDFRIPGVTVTLYVCYDSANDLLISQANVTKNKTCSAQGTNVGWLAIDTQTTDLNGEYLFEGLLDAYYYVAVDNTSLPGGSGTQTAEASFAADGTGHNTPLNNTWGESNVNTTNLQNNSGVNIFNPINNAETITDVSFGYTVKPMLYGYLWQDFDADGVIDSNEPYLDNLTGGIIVTLSTASGVISTTQTDSNGYYEFPGLTAGVLYTITVDTSSLPGGAAGWSNTYDPDNGTISPDSQYPLAFTLTAGQISGPYNFGYVGNADIGDTIYYDWNGDGSQGVGENGIAGVDVYLYYDENGDGLINGSDTLAMVETTSITGYYRFENVPGDNWIVWVDETSLIGYTQTADPDGTNDGKHALTTDGSTDELDVDFGYQPTGFGTIGDYVWYDSNSNGLQGSNESGLANIEVTLYVDDGDGIFNIATDPVIITTTTDANGNYLFTKLISATYWVDVDTADSDLPTDGFGEPFILTTNNDPLQVVLNSGDTYLNADFGFDGPAVVGNFVWQDNDGDGEQDPGEPGIAGITVRLFQETSPGVFTLVATDTTDSAGRYLFSGLISDTYRVVVDETTLPTGYSQQTGDPDVGSISGTSFACDDTNGSAVDDCDAESTFQLKTGQIDLTRDFGYLPPRFTGNYIWFDADGDGVQDFTEPGLGGITVTVTLPGGGTFTTFTDIEGYYSFGSDILGTTNGNFTITIDPGSTYTYTYDYDGSTATPDGTTVLNIAATNFYTDVIDFGLQLNGPHTITGTVFYDEGNTTDGLTDTFTITDTPFANVTVYLYKEGGGAPVGITTTDASGHYTFTNLLDGEVYVVSIDTSSPVIAGYDLTASPTSGSYFHILPALTGDVGDIDFGFWEPVPILSLTKTVSPAGIVSVGDTLTYTLTISNTGALTATGVIITDTVPVSTTFVTATTPYSGPTNGVITWTLGSVATDTNRVVTMAVRVQTTTTLSIITNTAWLTSNEGITATDTVTTPLQRQPDLTITKQVTPQGLIQPGDALTYTVIVSNSGSSDATNVTISDTLPSEVSLVKVLVEPSGNGITGTTSPLLSGAVIMVGERLTLTMVVTVNVSVSDGTVMTNTASVTSTEIVTPANSNPVTNTVGFPILSIAKINNPVGPIISGHTLTYTLIVSNTGSVSATNVTISDTLPVEVSHPAIDVQVEPAGNGVTSTSPPLLLSGATITPNTRITLTVVVTVDAGIADGTVFTNTASITSTEVVTPEISNPVTNTVVSHANISGQVRDDVDSDGVLADLESGILGVTIVLYSDPNGDGDPSDGSPLLTTTTTITGSYIFTNVIPGNYVVIETDPAGYTGTADAQGANDNQIPVTLVSGIDSTGNDFLDTLSATIGNFVWNDEDHDGIQDLGEPGIPGITVTLYLGATPVQTVTTDASGLYTFTNVISDNYTIRFNPLTYTVTSQNQGGDDTLDSDADSSGATALFTVNAGDVITDVDAGFYIAATSADLLIEKYDNPKVVAPGDTLTYTIRFENKGPSAVNAITITETLPAEVNSFSYNVDDAKLIISPTLTLTGAAAISDAVQVGSMVTWTGSYPTSPIISGTVGYITFTVKVDQSYLPGDDHLIENSLVITSNQPDPNLSDNIFTETTPIADIVVEKATNGDDADTITGPLINFGDPVTWTYQVTNTGSITLTGVQITDRDDIGNLVVITPTVAITLAPGEMMTFTYVATASATGQYTNTATVTGTATANGNDAFGNAVTSTTTLTDTDLSHYITALVDVTIVKSDSPDPVTLGKVLTYTLVYTNNGPASASNVLITDTLPSEVTFGGMVSGSSPTQNGQLLIWNIGALGDGLGGSLIFTVTVDSAGTGTITNSVVITTSTPDSNPSNNDDDEPTTVESPGITISKTPDLQTVETGSTVTFTITVTNTGDVTLTQVVVSDALVSNCNTGPISLLPKATQTYTCTTAAGVTAGFTNTAIVSGISPGGTVVTSTDTAVVEVITPGLEIEKTVNIASAAPSQMVTYTITITNTGDVTLNPVRITDTMDTGLTYISGSASIAPSSVNGQQLVWNDATVGAGLAADDTLQLTLLAEVTTITGTYNNVAVAVGHYPTGSTTPASDSAPVVVEDPAVEVTKGVAAPGAVNSIITFTIRITNTGPSTLDQVPLFDRFVGPIEYIGGTPLADSVDNTNKVLSWDDLTQAGPNGFGQNLEPDDMYELTTVFRITANSSTFAMINTAEVTGAVDIFNNMANDADETVTLDNEPTAIDLLYFKGVHQGENIILNWATAVEIDNYGFRLFRSATASRADAVEIAFVPGQGLGTGSGATYTYTDKQVAPNQTYTYWLVDIDLNGTETEHSPVTVTPTGIDSGNDTRLYLPLILHAK